MAALLQLLIEIVPTAFISHEPYCLNILDILKKIFGYNEQLSPYWLSLYF